MDYFIIEKYIKYIEKKYEKLNKFKKDILKLNKINENKKISNEEFKNKLKNYNQVKYIENVIDKYDEDKINEIYDDLKNNNLITNEEFKIHWYLLIIIEDMIVEKEEINKESLIKKLNEEEIYQDESKILIDYINENY